MRQRSVENPTILPSDFWSKCSSVTIDNWSKGIHQWWKWILGYHHQNSRSLSSENADEKPCCDEEGNISIIPKSYHHHVIRSLTYIFSLNPNTWRENPCCLSIFHENTQHHAFPVIHERYLAHTACALLSISGATAYSLWSISVSNLNRYVIRGEKRYPR